MYYLESVGIRYIFELSKQTKTKDMNITLQEFITKTNIEHHGYIMRPKIVCNDGFFMSVQAGKGLYSDPRKTASDYLEVEIGDPSQEEPLINPYAEENNNYTKTVYPYVPFILTEQVIEKHGGINEVETFKEEA